MSSSEDSDSEASAESYRTIIMANQNATNVVHQLNLQPPSPLSFEGNIAENWEKWYKKFDIYLKATESESKSDAVKIAILLHTVGEEGHEKFDTFGLTE